MIKCLENKYLVEDPVDFHGEPLTPGTLVRGFYFKAISGTK